MCDSTTFRPRTAVRDAVLSDVTDELDADAVAAVESCAIDATEAACLSYDNLLDWGEYREVAL